MKLHVATQQVRKGDAGHPRAVYVTSFPGLIDKYVSYLLTGRPVPPFIVFVFAGWVLVQDNDAGRLQDWGGAVCMLGKWVLLALLYGAFRVTRRTLQRRRTRATSSTRCRS